MGWAILRDKGEIEFRNLRENQVWISDFAVFDVLYLQNKYLLVFMKGIIYFSDDRKAFTLKKKIEVWEARIRLEFGSGFYSSCTFLYYVFKWIMCNSDKNSLRKWKWKSNGKNLIWTSYLIFLVFLFLFLYKVYYVNI